MNEEVNRPKVGVGVIIVKDSKILLGKRRGNHGDGMWAPPGGHLEFKEEIFDCAKREVLEETGLEIENLTVGTYTNDTNIPYDKHYITVFVYAEVKSGEPKITEPEKCYEWRWCNLGDLPKPLFYCMQNYIDAGFKPDK